jgi:hypothetical protein
MMARLATYLLALATLAGCARAEDLATPEAHLGKAGVDITKDAIKARAALLHLSMACGNELDFARRFALQSQSYKNNHPPAPGVDGWPVDLMIGKAARLIDQSREGAACENVLEGNVAADWGALTHALPGDSVVDVVNRVYHELYDGETRSACASVAHVSGGGPVSVILTDACIARQISAVITDPGHGPWEWSKGVIIPELPGTDPSALPCLSEFKVGIDGVAGDWDQEVLKYTRLASLLYRYRQSSQPIGAEVEVAIAALNRRFLTVRSSPDQGATARELFNLVGSCGDQPNQFGDAIDTVNGTGTDPGMDSYSDDAKDAVGKKSWWDDFLRFLAAAVVTVVAPVVAGAIVAGLLGLLTGVGTGIVAVVIIVAGVIAIAGGSIEESENHLLMQNSERYIKNKLMMAELSAQGNRQAFDTMANLNEELRIWLLEHMKTIAAEDFVEYNAKPYNRLSHASILNLLDYACDVSWEYEASPFILNSDRACDEKDFAIVRAAASVLDLSAAKLAVGSLEGRRMIPYRRLAQENSQFYDGPVLRNPAGNRPILELVAGADNQLAALQIWTGQMRHAPNGVAWPATFEQLEWWSTSQYRPDPMILDMAVNKAIGREQQYRHHTRERYASGNGWLITAGGSDEGQAQPFRLGGIPIYAGAKKDRGVGVPTTLMTSAQIKGPNGDEVGRDQVQQFLRFDGNRQDWGVEKGDNGAPDKPRVSYSDNNCVAGSFACGLALQLPSDFDPATCRTVEVAANFFVVDSTKCDAFNDRDRSSTNDILIAIFQSPKGWGFFEVAQRTQYGGSAAAFAADLTNTNKGRFDSWNSANSDDTVEYFAPTQGRLLKFTPKDETFSADRRACGVVNHESSARLTISNVPAVQAGACLSVGPRIFIDLNDTNNPIRRGEGGLALEPFGR